MNICIVTVYNSLNHGSYLQSYALSEVIKSKGLSVAFLETKARNPFWQTTRYIIKSLAKVDLSKLKFDLLKFNKFKEANKVFNLVVNNHDGINSQDAFVFGSDEIWNISREEFNKYPIFWGDGIKKKPKISYAVSINTTSQAEIINNQSFIQGIRDFSQIGVRDKYTQITLSQILKNEISLVLDPTFLLDLNFYSDIEERCEEEDFILVYSYGHNMNEEKIKRIVELSRRKKMKLISVGFYLDWCHKSIAASPFEFLGYLRKANYVITDTFHGTVFSIIYNKQFVTYAGSNRKIVEVLSQFDIEKCNVDENSDLIVQFNINLNYNEVNKMVEMYKKKSLDYIDRCLNAIGDIL